MTSKFQGNPTPKIQMNPGVEAAAVPSERRILVLGICCMASKAASVPMQAILRRLEICGDFKISIFPEKVIVEQPPEQWPVVECLIAFFSKGFPLAKCVEYVKLRNPSCVVNNIEAQQILCSRSAVYRTLQDWYIPCPDYIAIDHKSIPEGSGILVENENFLIYKGKKICKPFVEKPENADRHDIWIYYPKSIGGGAKKLFRKVKDQSSEFDPNQNTIRTDGTYLYEPFLPTQGTDIKVYTIGAGYVHAEARKAPTVDGKVTRSKDGKEVRYPVVLTQGEKAMAAFIVKAFRQNVCGFDILRTDGGSLVCDVNGWSFVKGNQKYYNDCATLLRKHLLDECGVQGVDTSTMMILGPGDETVHEIAAQPSTLDYSMRESLVNRSPERLRSVLVVMRHGDRRPKEKLKFKTKHGCFLQYFDSLEEGVTEVKLTIPEELAQLRQKCEVLLATLNEQLVQIEAKKCQDDTGKDNCEKIQALREDIFNIEMVIPVLQMKDRFSGLERKVQLKATKWKDDGDAKRATQAQVIAKWGGELTRNGLAQAQELGARLRHDLYPNDPTGLLRLHSSFRHDFKIYSSQEGRCQITAAAFTKGFLDLDGDIIPILVSLVTRDSYAQAILDEPVPKNERDDVKQKIEALLLRETTLASEEILGRACPSVHKFMKEAASRIGSPLEKLHKIRRLVAEYIDSIAAAKQRTYEEHVQHNNEDIGGSHDDNEDCRDDAVPLGVQVPQGPCVQIPDDMKDLNKRKWLHLRRKEHRWRKLFSGFVKQKDNARGLEDDSNVEYNASNIPDLWDNLYYDMITHRHYLGEKSCSLAETLVALLHPLNEWVCSSEYGISREEKLRIGVDVTWRLIGKMLNDLEFMIEDVVGMIDEAGQLSSNIDESRLGTGQNQSWIKSAIKRRNSVTGCGWDRESSSAGMATPQDVSPKVYTTPKSAAGQSPPHGFGAGLLLNDSSAWKEMAGCECPRDFFPFGSPREPRPTAQGTEYNRSESRGDELIKEKGRRSRLVTNAGVARHVGNELKQAMRDSSDWHPRLNDQVTKHTDIKLTRSVRSRVYVTSASTMHSLLNILRNVESNENQQIASGTEDVADLNYLTHLVFRCYEQDENERRESVNVPETCDAGVFSGSPRVRLRELAKARYRVEISMSPGVQVYSNGKHVQWPEGPEVNERNCLVAPLQIITESIELSKLEKLLAGAVKEHGPRPDDVNDDDKEDKETGGA